MLPSYDAIGAEASCSCHHVSFAVMLLYPDTKRQQNYSCLVTLVKYFVSAMRIINSYTSFSCRLKFFQIMQAVCVLSCSDLVQDPLTNKKHPPPNLESRFSELNLWPCWSSNLYCYFSLITLEIRVLYLKSWSILNNHSIFEIYFCEFFWVQWNEIAQTDGWLIKPILWKRFQQFYSLHVIDILQQITCISPSAIKLGKDLKQNSLELE